MNRRRKLTVEEWKDVGRRIRDFRDGLYEIRRELFPTGIQKYDDLLCEMIHAIDAWRYEGVMQIAKKQIGDDFGRWAINHNCDKRYCDECSKQH